MTKTTGQNTKIQDTKAANALERMVNKAVSDGAADVFLCTLQLPRQFSQNQRQANDIYKRIQSDFCKCVMRKTGETPRYITVKTDDSDNPEYAFCLFTNANATLEKPEEYADKGREIANGKAGQAGWGRGRLDIIELIRDAPKFTISSRPIRLTDESKASAMERLQEHLKGRSDSVNHQKTIFVSKSK